MPTLYVTLPGAVVRKSAKSLVITVDSTNPDGASRREEVEEVEPHRVDLIMLFGRTHITSSATRFCLQQGIDLAWLTSGGRLLGRVVSETSRSAEVRLAQYRRATDENHCFAFARKIVTAKTQNGLTVLRTLQSNRHGDEILMAVIKDLQRSIDGIADATSMATLLGFEGIAARHYFAGLKRGFVGDIVFNGRAKRPPPDPANALLSFGYVLLGNRISSLIEANGLDPAIGFYHELRPGRTSLALDLVEELRGPVVDRFILRLCNLRIVRPDMFVQDSEDGGVKLTRPGLRTFFTHWEKNLARSMREEGAEVPLPIVRIIRRQVERFASDLRGGESYKPVRTIR